MPVRFDESLASAVQAIANIFGAQVVDQSVFVRDAAGYLSAILPTALADDVKLDAEVAFRAAVKAYARPTRPLVGSEAPGAASLLREGSTVFPLTVGSSAVKLLDRRVVGADWLRAPRPSTNPVPRIVFCSLKGGVGRSTALSVLCAHLSREGRRVLAIDLDIEAPGIGTMLLGESALPRYGTLDYLVENGLSGIDDEFIADCIGNSYLGKDGARVAVMPAIGRATLDNPANALAKISRAYVEDIQDDGPPKGISDQIGEMVERVTSRGEFDVVLLDARAGLHELAAGPILGLGGNVLLFGIDEPQTYMGYKLLLAHLAQFPVAGTTDWRGLLQFIHAKAPYEPSSGAEERFRALSSILYGSGLTINEEGEKLASDDFEMHWADDRPTDDLLSDEIASPIRIYQDNIFSAFDPVSSGILMNKGPCEAAFGEMLRYCEDIVNAAAGGVLA